MAELCRRTETPRETVHHYLRLGLLSAPRKTFKNMAYYDERHVEELLLIKRLRAESYLPLDRIKAVLDEGRLAESARALDLAGDLLGQTAKVSAKPLKRAELAQRSGLSAEAVERYVAQGVLHPDAKGRFGALELKIAEIVAGAEQELDPALSSALAERFGLIEQHVARLAKDELSHFFAAVVGGLEAKAAVELLHQGRASIGRYLGFARARRMVEEIQAIFAEVEGLVRVPYVPAPALPPARRRSLGEAALKRRLLRAAEGKAAGREPLFVHLLLMGDYAELVSLAQADDPPRLRLLLAEALIELARYPEALDVVSKLAPEELTPFADLVSGAALLARLRDDLAAGLAETKSSEPWAALGLLQGATVRGLAMGLLRLARARPGAQASSEATAVPGGFTPPTTGPGASLETQIRFHALRARIYGRTPSFLELGPAAVAALDELERLLDLAAGEAVRAGLVERYRLVLSRERARQ